MYDAAVADRPSPQPRYVAPATVARIIEAAAVLWCRHATFPTAREVGARAGVAPSTVVSALGGMRALLDAVVDIEVAALQRCAEVDESEGAMAAHLSDLRARDASLVHLPWLAALRRGQREKAQKTNVFVAPACPICVR